MTPRRPPAETSSRNTARPAPLGTRAYSMPGLREDAYCFAITVFPDPAGAAITRTLACERESSQAAIRLRTISRFCIRFLCRRTSRQAYRTCRQLDERPHYYGD